MRLLATLPGKIQRLVLSAKLRERRENQLSLYYLGVPFEYTFIFPSIWSLEVLSIVPEPIVSVYVFYAHSSYIRGTIESRFNRTDILTMKRV